MSHNHVFPRADADFNSYADSAIPYLANNADRLAVSKENVTLITGLQADWDKNWQLYINDSQRTTTVTAEKNSLRGDIEKALRTVYGDIPQSVLTTNDCTVLHLRERDAHGTRVPPMTHPLAMAIAEMMHLQHTLHFQNSSTPGSKAIPEGQMIYLQYFVGEAAQTAAAIVFGSGSIVTHFKTNVVFTEAEVGQTCYYRCCYENKHQERSPWSTVLNALVG